MKYITFGQNNTNFGVHMFTECKSLKAVIMAGNPESVDAYSKIHDYMFSGCTKLKYISFPKKWLLYSSTYKYELASCISLKDALLTYMYGGSYINERTFSECEDFNNIRILPTIKTIGKNAFYNCKKLESIEFKGDVTTIGANAFDGCFLLLFANFSNNTQVPSLGSTSAFSQINPLCKIIVPDALYDDWIVATNWATYAKYIYKASEVSA